MAEKGWGETTPATADAPKETGWATGEQAETIATFDVGASEDAWSSTPALPTPVSPVPSSEAARGRGRGGRGGRGRGDSGPGRGDYGSRGRGDYTGGRGRGADDHWSRGRGRGGSDFESRGGPSNRGRGSARPPSSGAAGSASSQGAGPPSTSTPASFTLPDAVVKETDNAKPAPVGGEPKKETGWGGDALTAPQPATTESGKETGWTSEAPAQPAVTSSAPTSDESKETGWTNGKSATAPHMTTSTDDRKPATTETTTNGATETEWGATEGAEPAAATQQNGDAQAEPPSSPVERKPRPPPYINPNRVDTGGLRKAKLTDDELNERMAAARLKNEQLMAKRQAVDRDEDDWREQEAETLKAKEEERLAREAKAVRLREVQQSVDDARAKNAARKLQKVTGRQWDAEKKEEDFDPRYGRAPVVRSDEAQQQQDDLSSYMVQSPQSGRGGRGRGMRGRGGRWGADREGPAPPIAKTPGELGDPNEYPALFK